MTPITGKYVDQERQDNFSCKHENTLKSMGFPMCGNTMVSYLYALQCVTASSILGFVKSRVRNLVLIILTIFIMYITDFEKRELTLLIR